MLISDYEAIIFQIDNFHNCTHLHLGILSLSIIMTLEKTNQLFDKWLSKSIGMTNILYNNSYSFRCHTTQSIQIMS
jgi:hypothetical protein